MEALELYRHSAPLMWRFFFGLLRDHTSETTTKLFEKFAHIHISTTWFAELAIMMCAYELKQTAIAEVLVQVLNYSITLEVFGPLECAASAYVISLNPHQFRRLEIGFSYVTENYHEECFDSMLAELPNNNKVEHVTLKELSLTDGTVSAMVKLLQYFPHLQKLELFKLYMIPGIPLTVAQGLKELKHVRHFGIRIEGMFSKHINATILTEVLTHLPHLEHLSLRGGVAVKEIGTLLEHMTNLQHLDLSHNFIGADGAVALAKGLRNKVNLQYLALEYNDIGNDGAVAIAEGLKNAASLKKLKLSDNTIGADGAAALAEGIKRLTSLQVLELEYNLRWNRIGADGAAALAESIKHLTSLHTLDLCGNRIGADGAAALAEGIKHLTSLEVLELVYNDIGDNGAAALVEGIKHLTSLQTLNLRHNRIGDNGVVALTRGLKNLTSLKELILDLNEIGNIGAAQLAEETKHLKSLEILNLRYNKISDGEIAKSRKDGRSEAVRVPWKDVRGKEFVSER